MAQFSIALSGLTAASSDLDVTANNVANADTVGFKDSRAEFADVYSAGAVNLNPSVVGQGVRLTTTAQQFTQGNITSSSSNLDLAISGDGFFTLHDANGYVYSRNGQFSEDKTGNVVSATGQALQVYPPLLNGGFNTGTLTDLNLQTAQSAPLATTSGTVILNLPANSTAPAVTPFDPTNSQTYNQSTSTSVYDSLGNQYSATFYFTQTATPNQWNVNMTVNGTQVGAAQPITFSSTGAVATFVSPDRSTKGSWRGVYGADGYSVANDSQSLPVYVSFAVQNQLNDTWASTTTDPRALQTGSNTGRIAATWYSSSSFNFDVNFTDGNAHRFALYALDWDSSTRAETIQIVDANSSAVLDTRSISQFQNGIYLVWNISGHVKIIVTRTGGANAVISGAFFGTPPPLPPSMILGMLPMRF